MDITINIFKFVKKELILLSLIFIFFSDFFDARLSISALVLIYPTLYLKKKSSTTDKLEIWIALFSIINTIFATINNSIPSPLFIIVYLLGPIICYKIGKYLVTNYQSSRIIIFFLIYIIITNSLKYIVIGFADYRINGMIVPERGYIDIGEENPISATYINMRLSIAISALPLVFALAKTNYESYMKFGLFSLGSICFLTTMHYLNRTGFVLVGISLIGTIFFLIYNKHTNRLIFALLVLTSIVSFIFYYFDFTIIKEAFLMREQSLDHNTFTGGGRIDRWVAGLKQLFLEPTGLSYKEDPLQWHNLWLDVGKRGSTLSFIFLTIPTIYSIRNQFKYIFINRSFSFLSHLILCMSIGFFLQCFVEPLIINYLLLYIIFWGIVNTLIFQKIQF